MSWKRNIRAALRALQREREQLQQDLAEIDAKIERLETLARSRDLEAHGSPRLSPAGREAISKAAKARWAEYRRKKAAGPDQGKRKGS